MGINQAISSTLTGRKFDVYVKPLLFEEFCYFHKNHKLSFEMSIHELFRNPSQFKKFKDQFSFRDKDFLRFMDLFLLFGGYPEVAAQLSGSGTVWAKRKLGEIYTQYIRKDVQRIGGIAKESAFDRLVSLLSLQAGSIYSEVELANSANISRNYWGEAEANGVEILFLPAWAFAAYGFSREIDRFDWLDDKIPEPQFVRDVVLQYNQM